MVSWAPSNETGFWDIECHFTWEINSSWEGRLRSKCTDEITIRLTSTHGAGSGTIFLDKGWSHSYSGIALGKMGLVGDTHKCLVGNHNVGHQWSGRLSSWWRTSWVTIPRVRTSSGHVSIFFKARTDILWPEDILWRWIHYWGLRSTKKMHPFRKQGLKFPVCSRPSH